MYPINTLFEWDADKARRNAIKHGIGFKKATTAFHDQEAVVGIDEEHSTHEARLWLTGQTAEGQLVTVIYTENANIVRMISARPANQEERNFYEKNRPISF